jgi:hypothetical protein
VKANISSIQLLLLDKAMAPKAAMKSVMKTAMKTAIKAVKKTAMKVKAASSSDSCVGPTAAEKKKITKQALVELGKYSLQDKVQKALENNEGDPEAAADEFKKSLTKLEHSKLWGQHQTFLKNNPDQSGTDGDSKKSKGLACALWFLQTKGQKFLNMTHKVGGQVLVKKTDEWQSEKQMIDRFGETDFKSHCSSGRIIWRECPITRGTYEYKDQHQISRETTTYKGKDLVRGQEQPLDNDVDQMFEDLYQQEICHMQFCFNQYISINIF